MQAKRWPRASAVAPLMSMTLHYCFMGPLHERVFLLQAQIGCRQSRVVLHNCPLQGPFGHQVVEARGRDADLFPRLLQPLLGSPPVENDVANDLDRQVTYHGGTLVVHKATPLECQLERLVRLVEILKHSVQGLMQLRCGWW